MCTSLQERVSAIETLLNGKTFITGAPVQTEKGYDLGYVQVTLGEDGKLTTSKEQTISINHGITPEFNVTVGPDPANPNNGKIYWLINGKPMLDASGNPVEAPKDGKDAPEPTFHIWDGVLCYTFDQNPDLTDRSKNTWYELQNVIGPQGPVGPQGPSGLSITTDENGKVTITYDHDANPDTPAQTAELPTYASFMKLYDQVQKIQANIDGISTLVGLIAGNKDADGNITGGQEFITDYRPVVDANGVITGFQFQTVKYVKNAEGNFEVVASGVKTVNGLDGKLIKLIQDENDGKYYWVLPNGTKLPVKGEDGADAAQPKFCIVNGHLWYTLDENPGEVGAEGHKWQDLGSVAALLKEGNTDTNKSLVTITRKPATDGKNEVLAFTFGTGEDAVTIEVPTQGAFEDLIKRVAALETNSTNLQNMISAIDGRVKGLEGWLQGMKFVDSYELIKDQSGKLVKGFKVKFVTYEAVVDGNTVTYNKKAQTETVEYTDDGLLSLYYDETAGEWYWVFGQDNMIPVKAFKPIFQIHEGHIYASLKKTEELTKPYDFTKTAEWEDLGAVEPELGTTGQVLVGVTETDGYVNFTFKGKDGQETTLSLPNRTTFEALQAQVATANTNITSLQELVTSIDTRLTIVEGDVTTLKGYKHVKDYRANLNDNGDVTGYRIEFTDGSIVIKNGVAPQISIKYDSETKKYYWTLNGEWILTDNGRVEAVGPKGEDGVTPIVKISDDGYWVISYDGGQNFEQLKVNDEPVKARGDKGEQGDSMFANPPIQEVDTDGDGTMDKLIIKLADGKTQYEFPTWAAFEALKNKVDAINTTVKAFSDILNGTKFIQNITSFEDKNTDGVVIATGYELTYVEYTSAGLSAPKTERIYNGSVVGIKLDPSNNKYYWTINGTWLYDGNGNKVLAAGEQGVQGEPGADAPIPQFSINEKGELIVTVGDKVTNLGDVTGETGKDGAVNITWDGKENTVNPVAAKDADYIYIQYGPATEDVIQVPTRKAFDALQARVGNLESDVTALKELVADNTFVQDINYMKDAEGKIIGFKATVAQYILSNGKYTASSVKEITYRDDQITAVKEGNDWYWVIKDAEGNQIARFKLTGSDFTPVIKYYNGHLYVSNSPNAGDIEKDLAGSTSTDVTKGYWTDLGQITPSNGTDGVTLESVAEGTGEDAGYIVMTFVTGKDASGNKTYQTMKVPTKATFDALVTRVANLEANVDALETLVAESTFVKNITTKTATDSNGYEYVNGFDAVMVKYQKVNGVWTEVSDGTYPKTITYTDDKITLVKNAETGAWEWKIKTNDADGVTTITLPASGGAPRFELFDGRIYVAIDPRATTPETDLANDSTKGYWRDLGLLNPGAYVDGGAGNSLLSVDTNDNGTEVTFKFTDGNTIVVPTQSAFAALNASVAQLNDDVKALQDIVKTIQEEDYVTRYEELKEDTANPNTVTGIRLHFKKGGSVDIDYGKDGVAPEIGVTYGEDGILYWTIGGQPLYYPGTTNPVPASYPTPIFDVTEDGELKVSYNNGSSWDSLGKVVGEQGDSMFKNVELSEDGMFILVTLNDNVEYKLPVWQDLSITLAQNSLSFTTGQELSVKYTIKGPLSSGMPEVATIAEGDWSATYTIEDKNDSQMSGYIVITAPAEGQRLKSGKVLVFASIHGQTVMKSISTNTNSSFGSEGVVDTDANEFQLQNGQLNLDYKRRDLTLKFTTNTVANQTAYDEDYYLEAIYDDVDNDWIEGVTNGNPLTRAITVTNQITVKTNTGTNTRSATIKVMKRGSSGAVYTFQIRQSGVKNLNADSNYANCFIVSEPGVYKFTAVKGYDNTTGFISGINSRSVLWAKNVDGKDLSLNNIRVYEAEDLGSGVVIFEVGTYVAGNAVIQVSNGSSALWSWHIWFRAKPGNTNSGTMMDWNLGASGATDEGLYYQWGRKDPFYGNQSVASGGTEANGIANPDIFYGDWNSGSWASTGDDKTIYDPCPKGYKVPSKSVFGSENTEPSTNYATIGGLRYRYGGYLYPDTESGVAALREESQKGVLWLSDVDGTTPMHLYYERYQSRAPSWGDWYGEHKLFISTNNKDREGKDISKSQAHGLNVRCVKE